VDDLKELLVEPREKLDAKVVIRTAEVESVSEYQMEATKIIKVFKQEYEKCLQELSLKEGLGKKYGAPRRNAQERLRTEVTRDEYSAANVDKLLSKLAKLCEAAKSNKQVQFTAEEAGDDDDEEEKLPVAVRITHVLRQVRAAIFRRVKYLEFNQSKEEDIGAEEDVGVDMEEQAAGVEHEVEDAMIVGTFAMAIKKLQDMCKQETYDLYAGEGKTDLLGDAGVPE
jgi:hypothetical protein